MVSRRVENDDSDRVVVSTSLAAASDKNTASRDTLVFIGTISSLTIASVGVKRSGYFPRLCHTHD